ncbi:uncharacterized protein [Zea mays]|uniref:uncharacterized protein n=1 Tax=Zea mays TaxID=4577 RepID=UPI0009AAA2F8|nr:uncharacterized protein LOC109942886 [Zea mays]|eukprot:XP_020401038.1 uncharacterized protein LOC109942886 [Zea mays]
MADTASSMTSANRRSVNLREYVPSFAALDDTTAAVPAPRKPQAVMDDAELQRRKRLVVYKTCDVEGKVRELVHHGRLVRQLVALHPRGPQLRHQQLLFFLGGTQ